MNDSIAVPSFSQALGLQITCMACVNGDGSDSKHQ